VIEQEAQNARSIRLLERFQQMQGTLGAVVDVCFCSVSSVHGEINDLT